MMSFLNSVRKMLGGEPKGLRSKPNNPQAGKKKKGAPKKPYTFKNVGQEAVKGMSARERAKARIMKEMGR